MKGPICVLYEPHIKKCNNASLVLNQNSFMAFLDYYASYNIKLHQHITQETAIEKDAKISHLKFDMYVCVYIILH